MMSALPQKRTKSRRVGMSALCQKQTFALQQIFDHLVGAGEKHWWHVEAERFDSFEVSL
jgi:hypothetical protein